MIFFRILYCAAYVALWVSLDFVADRIAENGLSTPWYPQAALSLALLLSCGWKFVWLIPVAKLSSSMLVWPGPLIERIVPTLVFTAGIALLAHAILQQKKSSKRSLLIYGLISTLLVAVIAVPMAILRQAYYQWLPGAAPLGWPALLKLSWENWLGDTTTIICLTPGLVYLMGTNLPSTLRTVKRILREYWSIFFLLILFVAPLPLVPAELSHRVWYVFAIPCLTLAVFSGLEAAIFITFVTNILLGIMAVAFFPRANVVELQVFLLSINLVSLVAGAVVNESRMRIEELSRVANLALEGQFIKVRALMRIQSTMLEPLKTLVWEAEQMEAADLIGPAKELVSRLDTLSQQEGEPAKIDFYPMNELLKEWELIANEQTPAGAASPEVSIRGFVPETIPCDRAAARTIFSQLVNLVVQLQAPHTKPCIYVQVRGDFLKFRAEINPSSSFSPIDIDFLRHPDQLPAGGYALTAFILHSLVRGMNGRMEIFPHFFSFREILVVRIYLPLSTQQNAGARWPNL